MYVRGAAGNCRPYRDLQETGIALAVPSSNDYVDMKGVILSWHQKGIILVVPKKAWRQAILKIKI